MYDVATEHGLVTVLATWGNLTNLPLADGQLLAASPLWLHWFDGEEVTKIAIAYFASTGLHAVENRIATSQNGGGATSSPFSPLPSAEQSTWSRSILVGATDFPCGFYGKADGQVLKLAGPCFDMDQPEIDVHRSRNSDASFSTLGGSVFVAYHADSEFPSSIRHGTQQWTLKGLAKATAENLPQASFSSGIQIAPLTPWGPNDASVPVDFPLNQAYHWATRPQQPSPSMHEFLQRPGAYLAEAALHRVLDDSGVEQMVWQLVASDGKDLLERHVYQVPAPTALLAEAYAFQVRSPSDAAGRIPPPSGNYPSSEQLPSMAPTVLSAFQLLESWHPAYLAKQPANSWSYRYQCQHDDCSRAELTLSVGWTEHSAGRPNLAASVVNGERLDAFFVHLDEVGRILGLHEQSRGQALHAFGATPSSLGPSPGGPTQPISLGQKAAAVAGGLALIVAAWRFVRPFLLGLFSRTNDSKLLDQQMRRRIMDLVSGQPGITYSALVAGLETGRGIVDHHLAKLMRAGLVVEWRSNRVRTYFQPGALDQKLAQALSGIARIGARSVLRAVLANPGLTIGQAALAAGVKPNTASYHVQRLVTEGLIQQRKSGRILSLTPTPLAMRIAAYM